MPNLWIATFNQGKMREFEKLLRDLKGFELRSAKEFKFYKSPLEDGKTFLDNALIKAKAFKPLLNDEDWVLAEDSGLVVDALDGLPGIHSARYAGPKASDLQNNDKLLKMLAFKKTDNRKAHYFCQMVILGPKGQRIDASGKCEGLIAECPQGRAGFGYDPLFVPNGYEKTMAELTPAEKNKISHRAKACEDFIQKINR